MKNTIKTILLFFTAALVLTSCSSDDKNPPKSGFSLSQEEIIQWDAVEVTDNSSGAVSVEYTVTGGEFTHLGQTIQFLEAKSYTITQTVENEDGEDSSTLTVTVETPDNHYALDGTDVAIGSNAFWYLSSMPGATPYIRVLVEISGQDNPNLLKLLPVAGPDPLEQTYTWSSEGEVGTYEAQMTANYAGFSYDWTTKGNGGDDLKIMLVYEDHNNSDNNIYDIMLPSYTLNWGQFDWATGEIISEGTKEYSLSYRGKIDPVE